MTDSAARTGSDSPLFDHRSTPVSVIGLAGSPRRKGNTEILLDRFLAGAAECGARVEKLVLANLKVRPCVGCEKCAQTGRCAIHDDFQGVYDRLMTADVIALAAPMYFWNVPAPAKAVIDRSQCQWSRRFLLKAPLGDIPAGSRPRRGVFISMAGQSAPNFTGASLTVDVFFEIWEAQYWAELLSGDVDARGAVTERSDLLDQAYELGRKAVSPSGA